MINRLANRGDDPREEGPEKDYWLVEADCGWFYVTETTAGDVVRAVTRDEPRPWIRFTDLFGAQVWILTEKVTRVSESKGGHRDAARAFRRARRDEEREDRRPWEDGWL